MSTRVPWLWILTALLFLLNLFRQAHATSFYAQPFPDTVQQAPTIVRGKVGSSYADWGGTDQGGKRIYTFYELQVREVIKGQVKGATLIMRELGGEKDGVGMQVAGASHFERGEDVVVMLSSVTSDGFYDIRGLMMGKLNIKQDESGNEILTGPAIDMVSDEIMGGQADTHPKTQWTLDALRKLVASQSGNGKNSEEVSKDAPHPSPSPSAALKKSPVAAPQLQSSPSQEPPANPAPDSQNGSGSLPWILGAIVIGLGGVGTWAVVRNKK